jgi:hypothetical protein
LTIKEIDTLTKIAFGTPDNGPCQARAFLLLIREIELVNDAEPQRLENVTRVIRDRVFAESGDAFYEGRTRALKSTEVLCSARGGREMKLLIALDDEGEDAHEAVIELAHYRHIERGPQISGRLSDLASLLAPETIITKSASSQCGDVSQQMIRLSSLCYPENHRIL